MKEERNAPRIRLGCRLFFSNEDHVDGEATIIDVSKSGCAAESETTLEAGMILKLSIFLPDYGWQLEIDRALVRWVRGQIFGMEFQTLRPVQRERLRRLVAKFRST